MFREQNRFQMFMCSNLTLPSEQHKGGAITGLTCIRKVLRGENIKTSGVQKNTFTATQQLFKIESNTF